jgi:hypothetical protein
MRKSFILTFALMVVAFATLPSASAQFPVKIKIPKPSQPKPQATPAETSTETSQPAQPTNTPASASQPASVQPAAAQNDGQPAVAKDSIQVTAYKVPVFKGNYDVWSWAPRMEYRVNGPIASGSQLYVVFNIPGSAPIKFDCETGSNVQAGYWWKTECGGRDVPEAQSTTYVGPATFAIKMRNELNGADATLFNGKFKVARIHSNEVGPHAVNRFIYYVDQDWNIPIGYVYLVPDDVRGWNYPELRVAFWVRGEGVRIEPHLFYQGKEVGRTIWQGEEVGKPSCSSDYENGTMSDVDDAQEIKWSHVVCSYPGVKGWDKTGEGPGMFGPMYTLAQNPGEYELKILWQNHLARSIKFTVGPGGKLDNSLATSNKLGTDRYIVPVTVIGEQDGRWDRNAWRTDAYYGNPLSGFNAP